MTRKQWAEMTPEEQRIKVLKLWGWRHCTLHAKAGWVGIKPGGDCTISRAEFESLPDVLNDLNAMHSAEEMLGDFDCQKFVEHLATATRAKLIMGGTAGLNYLCMYHATAAQRAEAFVLTMEPKQ